MPQKHSGLSRCLSLFGSLLLDGRPFLKERFKPVAKNCFVWHPREHSRVRARRIEVPVLPSGPVCDVALEVEAGQMK
jgi:hypothetical protein